MDSARTSADQRRLLVATIRNVANWRGRKAYEFSDDHVARTRGLRSKYALLRLANFVEEMPDDDRDLNLHALRRVGEGDGRLRLTSDSFYLLSRFGIDKGAWQFTKPVESQMRNVIRRVDGIESRERHARKLRTEMGYDDE